MFAGTNPPPLGDQRRARRRREHECARDKPVRARTIWLGGGFGRYNGPRASREELLQRMRDHIHTVVGRYKGKIKVWDVVNEAIADGSGTNMLRNSLWLEIIGPDFIAKAFQYAHEADPDAILRYNDYGLENPAKRKKLITLIKSLQEQKVPGPRHRLAGPRQCFDDLRGDGSGADGNRHARLAHSHHRTRREQRAGRPARFRRRHRQQRRRPRRAAS